MSRTVEEQIDAELDALSKRLAGFHQKLKDRPAMKYALESLPELIGAQDFKDLCIAIGIDYLEDPTGRDVADAVRGAVIRRERKLARQEISPAFKALLDADHKAAAAYVAPSSVEECLR